ncbi:hypothetical protein GCM10023183_08280 [Nibribacter koreensis]|uniref:Por secretion system C-terminal sorting domain-containing protein n=2 Tax=Nibribacter koreensis TaxID=1084519 RepID=A0ABP8FB43_9BACT
MEWDKTYGGTDRDELKIVRHTSDGGYIMGGTSLSGISGDKTKASRGDRDFWVIKVDAAGAIEWNKVYGGNGADRLAALEQTSDGGYILGGSSNSGNNGNKSDPTRGGFDYWVVKINAKGKVQWDQTVGGSADDNLGDIIQTSDGAYLLGGSSSSNKSGNKSENARGENDYWIVKLSSKGRQQWDKTYGGNASDALNALLQTNDGGYLLGGGSTSPVSGDKTSPQKFFCITDCHFYFWVVKVDATGNQEWDKTYGAVDGYFGQTIGEMVHAPDGGYLLGGDSDAGANFDKSEPNRRKFSDYRDYWVVKIDPLGTIQWDKTLGGDGDERFGALLATQDGGFLVGGRSETYLSHDKTEPKRDNSVNYGDYWVVKLNATGTKLWDKTFGGSEGDLLTSMDNTSNGGYILGGYSDSPISGDKTEANVGNFDYWIVKTQGETCTTPTPSITLTRMANTYTGDVPSTLYLGYGPESILLTASGGTTYSWSPASGLSNTNTAETLFSPTEAGIYTFTVTIGNGTCTATKSVTITVKDVRCGSKLTKVMLCHKGQMICLADEAVKAHLKNHPEDRLGECLAEVPALTLTETNKLKVYPNPFTSSTIISFTLKDSEEYTVEVYEFTGMLMQRWPNAKGKPGQHIRLQWAPQKAQRGMYVVKLITKDGVQNVQVIRE